MVVVRDAQPEQPHPIDLAVSDPPSPSNALVRNARRRSTAPLLALALVAAALIRAATAPVPADAPPATVAARRAAFVEMADQEPADRKEAAHAFPGDLWSQDDDFHSREQKHARAVATKRGMTLADVLGAIDDGLRERWPPFPRITLKPGVPPCRPRLSY